MYESSSDLGERMARTILHDSLRVRPGENVTIESWSESLPWTKPFVAEARRIGARPMVLYEDEELFWKGLSSGQIGSLGTVGDHEWAALAKTDAYVFFFGPSEWPRFDEVPQRIFRRATGYNQEWYRRAARAKLRGVRMYLGRTSQKGADRFGVDLGTWRDELVKASLVPPGTMSRAGKKVANQLRHGKRVEVTHPNGTHLELRLKRYPVQVDDGIVDADDIKAGQNLLWMPSGVVGVALDESFGEGTVLANRSSYLEGGVVEGGRWTVRDGRLASYSYDRGAERFEKPYGEAPKGRDRPAYVSVGLNPEISMSPQMEDQELGAISIRIGGNRGVGGSNACPFMSWLALRGANLSVDGRPVVREGKLA